MIGVNFVRKLVEIPLREKSLINYQTVRWIRKPTKPFWLGVAKTKKFVVPKDPEQSAEEHEQLRILYNIYRTNRRSLLNFIINEKVGKEDITAATPRILVSNEDIERSLKENDDWNAASAALREERLEESAKEQDLIYEATINRQDTHKLVTREKAAALIKAEKEKSKTFITRDNIDKAIAECLATTVDYNYAIDLEGQIYPSSENTLNAPTTNVVEEEKQSVSN